MACRNCNSDAPREWVNKAEIHVPPRTGQDDATEIKFEFFRCGGCGHVTVEAFD